MNGFFLFKFHQRARDVCRRIANCFARTAAHIPRLSLSKQPRSLLITALSSICVLISRSKGHCNLFDTYPSNFPPESLVLRYFTRYGLTD